MGQANTEVTEHPVQVQAERHAHSITVCRMGQSVNWREPGGLKGGKVIGEPVGTNSHLVHGSTKGDSSTNAQPPYEHNLAPLHGRGSQAM